MVCLKVSIVSLLSKKPRLAMVNRFYTHTCHCVIGLSIMNLLCCSCLSPCSVTVALIKSVISWVGICLCLGVTWCYGYMHIYMHITLQKHMSHCDKNKNWNVCLVFCHVSYISRKSLYPSSQSTFVLFLLVVECYNFLYIVFWHFNELVFIDPRWNE